MANGLRDALDAAWGDFPTQDIGYDWLRYTGSARPSGSWVLAVTQHSRVTFIFETVSTRSQEGQPAGMMDCSFAEPRALEVHPQVASIAVVVSDGNYADNWSAYDYGYGWGLYATIAFFPYGAKPICQSFLEGARAALATRGMSHLLMDGDWIPETWGQGTLMSQVVGPSPIGNTDLNHVWAPYWPIVVAPPQQKDSDMHIGVNKAEGWFVNEGGKLAFHFTGPAGAFGVPSDLTGKWADLPSHVYSDAEVANLKQTVQVGSIAVTIDYDKMAQAVTAGMRGL